MSSATLTSDRPTLGEQAQPKEKVRQARPHKHGRAKSIVLGATGTLGMLCILWLVVCLVFGFSAIVFKTGSMAPTLPTGSIALERPIAAADITKGDVVTVPVPGQALPVTHRVVRVAADPGFPNRRILTLKGDANLTADQTPYTVSSAKLVMVGMPVGGTILSLLRTPLFIGVTCVLVILLLVWAFQPDPKRPRYARTDSSIALSQGETHDSTN